MSGKPITQFDPDPDPDRIAPLQECMENYDVGEPEAEWPNNIISRRTIVYGSGVIRREGDPVEHNVDPDELALCQRLAQEAATIMDGIEVGMGSESDDYFQAFFIAANVDDPVPEKIDESVIRTRFGGAIFPPATISVEPLEERGQWWSEVLDWLRESDDDQTAKYCAPWRSLMQWFRDQPEIESAAFVRIGDADALQDLENLPDGTEIAGCVLPRMAIGLTRNGSLAGIFGHSVQT